ncbi:hypothetical protein AVEN_67869-1, partial [Araneus ventricosus]
MSLPKQNDSISELFSENFYGIPKAGNSSVLHSICPNTGLFPPPISSRKNQARHSSEAPKCDTTALRSTLFPPLSGFQI